MSLPSRQSFTVAICAHNAKTRIWRALNALSALRYGGSWDVLVVDNASTDETGKFAERWRGRLPGLRVVREEKPGVAYARMRALIESRRDCLCFVDDDNLLASDYLDVADEIMQAHPEVGVLAGRSRLYELAPRPPWFDEVSGCYAVGEQANADGFLPSGAFPWGAGTVLRGAAIRALLDTGFEPQLTGRLGRYQLAGEDAEICLAINLLGWRSYYSGRLVLDHAIEPTRMRFDMLEKTCFGFGLSSIAIEVYRSFLQSAVKQRIKRSDSSFVLYLSLRLALACLRRARSKTARAKADYWSALGAGQAVFFEGIRPSRVLASPFFQHRLRCSAHPAARPDATIKHRDVF